MEISLNLLLLGDSCVGKTQILNHYIKKEYIKITYTGPFGLDYEKTTIEINEKKIHLKIWDHLGQRRFFSLDTFSKKFMKNQDFFILIYDITNRFSFEYIIEDISTIHEVKNKEDIILGIVGNKNDLYEERKVKFEEGRKLAEDNNSLFFEISAKDYSSIENIFFTLSKKYLEKKQIIKEETKTYENGDEYIGYLCDNKRYGEGIMKYNNGNIYNGYFKNDLKEGEGIMKYNNGNIYNGYWKNDLKEGEGLFCLNKDDYEIIKEINIFNLNEIFKLNNLKDLFYKGNYKNDKKEGEGILYIKKNNEFGNNIIYEGNFKNDKKEGFGTIYFKNKTILKSYWKEDKINEEKESIFCVNNLTIKNEYLNSINWINFIKNFGTINKEIPNENEDIR